MRWSPPTNRLSAEIANLTIRLSDALRARGVDIRWGYSAFPGSRSKHLRLNDGKVLIRVSDHHIPANSPHMEGKQPVDLNVVVRSPAGVAEVEARALEWIEQNYGSPQIQKAAA